jgi:hypothetical protein
LHHYEEGVATSVFGKRTINNHQWLVACNDDLAEVTATHAASMGDPNVSPLAQKAKMDSGEVTFRI